MCPPRAGSRKWCSGCGKELPFAAFASDRTKRYGIGLQSLCRGCSSERKSAWYRANREHVQARHAIYRATQRPKREAHKAVARALTSGALVRPVTCQDCHALCKPEAHHDDYAKPLDVRWLCRSCHRHAHEVKS